MTLSRRKPLRAQPRSKGNRAPYYDGPPKYCECGCGELTPILTRNRTAQGHRNGYPARFISGHNQRKKRGPRVLIEDRGYKTPCWIWQGVPEGSNGYGRVRVNGERQPAHRVYWEREFGPVPGGLQLDHLCRVPLCVNPDHLEPVTGTENVQRGNVCKLTPEQAQEIRREYAEFFSARPLNAKGEPRKRLPPGALGAIAERHGVSKLTVISVVKYRTWCP